MTPSGNARSDSATRGYWNGSGGSVSAMAGDREYMNFKIGEELWISGKYSKKFKRRAFFSSR
jgi:hypothetical protein